LFSCWCQRDLAAFFSCTTNTTRRYTYSTLMSRIKSLFTYYKNLLQRPMSILYYTTPVYTSIRAASP
jgi:hypothetical protein